MKKLFICAFTLLSALVAAQAQTDHSVARNTKVNQAELLLHDNQVKYYDTDGIERIDLNGNDVTVNISQQQDVYQGVVSRLSFIKGANALTVIEANGWLESAYVKFSLMEDASNYHVYVKGGNSYADWTRIDAELVRNYGDYGRADMVGLPAGSYQLKVVPVVGDEEQADLAAVTDDLTVRSYDRAGYAHFNYSAGVGAYNNDGSLKQGAKVFYVTAKSAKTITTNVNGATENPCVGIQAILAAYEKGKDTTPIAFRFIGLVHPDDLDYLGSSAEGLQVKGRRADSELNLTFEGIGDDATLYGFGFLVRNAKSVEFRNLAFMRFMDDGISLDTDNSNVWVHNIDFFYGKHGSGDHVKGDGAADAKSDTKFLTISYCRYWDCGKSSMFGMKDESGPNYISFHHNWFDHSDSRHPRVRTMSVHVWNNYFDNCAKYGVGACSGSSVFVENNYFLKTKKPILSSLQGTDGLGSGTFSDEQPGFIKAYGNYFDRSAKNFSYYTQKARASTGYDAYETATRDEQVPASAMTTTVTKIKDGKEVTMVTAGKFDYNNFDTNPQLIYQYTPDDAADVPTVVTGYYGAGRLNHGDISYTFADNVGNDDTDSDYDTQLAALIDNYKSALVSIFGENAGSGEEPGGGEEPGSDDPVVQPTDDVILCTFDKSGTPSSSLFTVLGNGSSTKGQATVDGQTLTTCLKMESATSIRFTLTQAMKMTLYFADTEVASIKIDGVKIQGTSSTYTTTLDAGAHELTKDKSVNLFAIKLEPIK